MIVKQCRPSPPLDDYFFATSVGEALAYLVAHQGEALLVAGGTYVMPRVQEGLCFSSSLVDVSRVHAMRRIARENGHWEIGGAANLARLSQQPGLLGYVCARIATSPIRELATIAGKLVSAGGNSELAIALAALEAEVQVTNLTGTQWLRLSSIFGRGGVSLVDSTAEIITAVRIRAATNGEHAALASTPAPMPGEPSPLILALVTSLTDDSSKIEWASLAAGAPRHAPVLLGETELALVGSQANDPGLAPRFVESLLAELAETRLIPDLAAIEPRIAMTANELLAEVHSRTDHETPHPDECIA